MRLVRATADFSLNGIPYAGFPLVLDDEMRLIEELHWFLVDTCLRAGTARSKATLAPIRSRHVRLLWIRACQRL